MIPHSHLCSRPNTDVCYTAAVMPLRREAVQLCLLLLSVPVQYLISGNLGTERLKVLPEVKHLQDIWFTLQSWNVRWLQHVSWMLRGKVVSLFSPLFFPMHASRNQSADSGSVSFQYWPFWWLRSLAPTRTFSLGGGEPENFLLNTF
jgi:hypothetical protein